MCDECVCVCVTCNWLIQSDRLLSASWRTCQFICINLQASRTCPSRTSSRATAKQCWSCEFRLFICLFFFFFFCCLQMHTWMNWLCARDAVRSVAGTWQLQWTRNMLMCLAVVMRLCALTMGQSNDVMKFYYYYMCIRCACALQPMPMPMPAFMCA